MHPPLTDNFIEIEQAVPFGHCDPAGILYTPRALDYCLEGIDAFWKALLAGTGWYELNVDKDRGTPFVNVNIDFISPVTARAALNLRVELVKVGSTSVTFQVSAFQQARKCFDAQLTSVLVVKSTLKKVDQADWLRQALDRVDPARS